MSLDEQNNTLVIAFSRPHGQTEGPQVFEINFNSENNLFHWNRIAHANVEKLNIPIKTKQDAKTLHVALFIYEIA